MRMNLWWIPRERVAELPACDIAVIRMCRVLTLFLAAAIVYVVIAVIVMSGGGARAERDLLRDQIKRCGCAEAR